MVASGVVRLLNVGCPDAVRRAVVGFVVALLLAACSRPAPQEPIDAGITIVVSHPARPWIVVTPDNACGHGVPPDFVRVMTGKRVEVWADPNDPGLDLKAILEGAKPR